jgi:hypothetical protein
MSSAVIANEGRMCEGACTIHSSFVAIGRTLLFPNKPGGRLSVLFRSV